MFLLIPLAFLFFAVFFSSSLQNLVIRFAGLKVGHELRDVQKWAFLLKKASLACGICFLLMFLALKFCGKRVYSHFSSVKSLASKDICGHIPELKYAFLSTLFWSLAAHAFCYYNAFFSHDSLYVFQDDLAFEISIGRFLQPLYRLLRGYIGTPWIVGLLSILYLTLISFMILRLFEIKDKVSVICISGVLSCSLVITLINATYITYSDAFMFSFLLSVFAVFACVKLKSYLLSILSIFFLCSIYQGYFQVAVLLFMAMIVKELLNKELSALQVIKKGLVYLSVLLAGLIVYFAFYKFTLFVLPISPSGSYISLEGVGKYGKLNNIFALFFGAYKYVFNWLIHPKTIYPQLVFVLNICFVLSTIINLILRVVKAKLSIQKLTLFVLILFLFPFGMNVVYFISKGVVHDLMLYSFYFIYIFAIVLAKDVNSCFNCFVKTIAFLFIIINCYTSNQIYVKKQLEFQSSLSVMTRILAKLESVDGYEPGVTPVVFIGDINGAKIALKRPGMNNLYKGAGSTIYYSFTYDPYAFVTQIMGYPINKKILQNCNKEELDIVKDMPAFPDMNSCVLYNGSVFIKLN